MGSAKEGGHSAVDENKESDIRKIVKWPDYRYNSEVHLKFKCII